MKRVLAVVLTLALFAWLATQEGWSALLEAARTLSLPALALGFAGLLASYFIRALRVHGEFRQQTIDGTPHRNGYWPCLRIVLIHNAMVNIVPFRGGEAAFPILLQKHFGVSLSRAIASLFWFRLQDAFVVMALAALIWPGIPTPLRVLAITVLVLSAWYLPRWAKRPSIREPSGRLASLASRLRTAFAESTRHARLGWLWTVSNWSVKLTAQAWLLAQILGSGFAVAGAGVLGAELAAIQPVQGVAGFGTYEAGAAAALLPNGIALTEGLKAALVLHLIVIASAVSAGATAWLWPGTPARITSDKSMYDGNRS